MESNRSPWIAVVVVVAIVVLLLLFGGFGMMGFGVWGSGAMGGFGYGAGPWRGILTMLFWLLVIAGIVLLVVWAVRGWQPMPPPRSKESDVLEILKQRYARGEISREDYQRMRQDLL